MDCSKSYYWYAVRLQGNFTCISGNLLSLSRAQDKVLGTASQMLLTGVRKTPFSILFRAVTKGQERGIFPGYKYTGSMTPSHFHRKQREKQYQKNFPAVQLLTNMY